MKINSQLRWRAGLVLALMTSWSVLAEPIHRLVSTDAGVTEILISLQADGRLVGVDATSQLPEALSELPRLGYHRALTAEGLLSLAPDLVVGSEHMGPAHALDTVRRARVRVIQLPAPNSIAGLVANVDVIAREVGATEEGAAVRAALLESREKLSVYGLGNVSAVFLLSSGGKLRMAGAATAGDAFIGLLGADNAADYRGYRSISVEALLELAADIILVADTDGAAVHRFMSQHPLLRYSAAARQQRVFAVDANSLVAGVSIAAVSEAERLLQQAAMGDN